MFTNTSGGSVRWVLSPSNAPPLPSISHWADLLLFVEGLPDPVTVVLREVARVIFSDGQHRLAVPMTQTLSGLISISIGRIVHPGLSHIKAIVQVVVLDTTLYHLVLEGLPLCVLLPPEDALLTYPAIWA